MQKQNATEAKSTYNQLVVLIVSIILMPYDIPFMAFVVLTRSLIYLSVALLFVAFILSCLDRHLGTLGDLPKRRGCLHR